MSKWNVPFDEEGNLITYDKVNAFEWKDNFEFEGRLKFLRFERGRSSAVAIFEVNGKEYPMFLTDLEDLLLNMSLSDRGQVWGYYNLTFAKRGCNYGIKAI